MKRLLLYLLLLPLFTQACHSQGITLKAGVTPDTARIRIIFAGDMMGHGPQITAAFNNSSKNYNYLPVFDFVRQYISSADLAIANLEVTLAGLPYSGYPQFSSPDALARGLKDVGFDMLITANNHALDRGKKGLERTNRILDSLGIPHTGTFKDLVEKKKLNPLFIEKNKIKLAFLNYTYGTNGIEVQRPNIVNYIDTTEIRKDIQTCRNKPVDFIIVTIHWGIEYERIPNREQLKLAAFIQKCGANAIIGSHPHVIQTYERRITGSDSINYFPIIYSLGNFVSNQRNRYCDGGIIFELNIEKIHSTHVKSCAYLPVWVYKGTINKKTAYRLIAPYNFEKEANALNLDSSDRSKCLEFFSDTRQHLGNLQEVKEPSSF